MFQTNGLYIAYAHSQKEMAGGTIHEPTPLLLSDDEKRILGLHDRLQQLQLEIALLTAQKNYDPRKFLLSTYNKVYMESD